MRHTGQCGRCTKPTGSVYREFCDGCRLVRVLAVNHARKGIPRPPMRGPKYKPVLGRVLPLSPTTAGESWWTMVSPGNMTAAALTQVPRMRQSKYGQMRGGPVIELWG